jgi:hypothetical protein
MSAWTKFGAIALALSGVTLGTTTTANAGDILPNFGMVWDATNDGMDPADYNPADFGEVSQTGNGTWNYIGGFVGQTWELDWNCIVHPGQGSGAGGNSAYVDAEIVVTNTGATTETYSLLMSLGAGPIAGPTSLSGGVSGSVTNLAIGGSATLAAPTGGNIYSAFIDVSDPNTDPTAATLWGDPYSLVASGPFASASDSTSFDGLVGGSVNSNVAILLTFTLSPGDTATVNGVFTVVPAPGALALFGLFGLAGRRRRA